MQQTEVMVRMVSESMKAVLKSTKKRTRKRELWESESPSETTDDNDDEGSVILSVRKILSGMDHDATLVEMSRLGMQPPYDLRLTTMTTSAWAERVNTLLTQNEGVRQRLMLSSRGKKGSKLIKGQKEVEKRKWMKRQWISNWEEMETVPEEGNSRGRDEPRRSSQGLEEGEGARSRAAQDRILMGPGQEGCHHRVSQVRDATARHRGNATALPADAGTSGRNADDATTVPGLYMEARGWHHRGKATRGKGKEKPRAKAGTGHWTYHRRVGALAHPPCPRSRVLPPGAMQSAQPQARRGAGVIFIWMAAADAAVARNIQKPYPGGLAFPKWPNELLGGVTEMASCP